MIQIDYAKPLHRIFTTDKRVKILVGGRGSTKSTGVADYVLARMARGALVCCARELQNSIEESVHRLMLDEIDRLEFDGFEDTKTNISHSSGGRNFYRGLARNVSSLKSSLSGIDILWIEEGESLSADTLRVLSASVRLNAKDTARKIAGEDVKFPEIIITMNRGSTTDPISKKFLARAESDVQRQGWYEDDLMLVVQCNYTDIPQDWFLASGLEQERSDDEKMMTKAQYRHKWHGDYLDEIDNTIILQEWFDAAVDAHIKLGFEPLGCKKVTHDPADSGDARADVLRHGSVILDARENLENDVNDSMDWSLRYAVENQVDMFIWDADGLGLSLKRQVNDYLDGKKMEIAMFHGGSGVDSPDEIYDVIALEYERQQKTNKESFRNKRSQYAAYLRDRFYKTYLAVEKKKYMNPDELISISSKIKCIDKLRAEVCGVPKKDSASGIFQLMPKTEMKTKYKKESPNLFDSLLMSELKPTPVNNFMTMTLDYDTDWIV